MDPLYPEIALPLSASARAAFHALPRPFMASLSGGERLIALDAFLYLDFASNGTKTPRELQIRAAIAIRKDLVVRSGTGTGKTIAMILPLLMMPNDAIAITISPLRLIQDNHVSEFSKYGISSLAINCYTPATPALWKSIEKHTQFRHYSVSPEQCCPFQGHIPRFAKLLRDQKWVKKIRLLQIDEAHFIVTAGQAKGKETAFRPAFSNLGERLRVHLPSTTPCAAYSASMPKRVMDVVMKTLRMNPTNTVTVALSTNRPNLVYATIPMIGTIDNLSNLNFLAPQPFPANYVLPLSIIFVDNKKKTSIIARNLNSRLPPELAASKPFQKFHSGMSKQYLEDTAARFRSGEVRGLVATQCASNGFDVPNIRLVVLYGVPQSVFEEDQRGGRGGRDGFECLVLMIAESWAYNNLAEVDPNHQPDTKEQRTEKAMIAKASSKLCRRGILAKHNDDDTAEALFFTSRMCCDNDDPLFNLSYWLPGFSLSVSDDSEEETPAKKVRKRYRPVPARESLELALNAWRDSTHAGDPVMKMFSKSYILPDASIVLLARELPTRLRIPAQITSFLEETPEWHARYALDVLTVICLYDTELSTESSSSDSESDKSNESEKSELDMDDIRQPTSDDESLAISNNSASSSASSTRSSSPMLPPAPRFSAAGRPLRQAAINHGVAGIANQISKRQKTV
ncbi:P-loop containing nucleoside triphosphate hydrolase protein [Mycena galericulata]|nr:P-loop containing nucleoside triphosphate hydrolase protein [Mycena galericulata]